MLYIVGTPIGNLEDVSLRQAKILTTSEFILTEDTRSTGTLLRKVCDMFSLPLPKNQRLISYYKEKEFEKLHEILELLRAGRMCSLISQSGLPLVSDPGYLLVQKVIRENLPFEVIPGPTASITALLYSGFNAKQFLFLGFLPKKTAELKGLIAKLREINSISQEILFVTYESPNRISNTLSALNEMVPGVDICVCRELTKKFEEISRGKPQELMGRTYKGEITLVIRLP